MHTLTFVILLISQTLDNSCSGTRLPLEVYELTPAAAAAASATETAAATHHLQQHAAAAATTTAADLKHKTLEYTTFDAKELAKNEAAAALSSGSSSTNKPPSLTTNADDLTVVSISAEQSEETAKDLLQNGMNVGQEQRRARQMQMHRYDGHDVILPMHLQKQQQQQQQQHLLHESETSSIRKRPAHGKDVRILYQVGDSEDDLPICAPNAVCSKIDLYETPWIERQCRCPESNRMPNVIIHHHNHHHQALGVGSAQDNSNNNNNNDKYRAYFEKEKLLQHKRLLMGDYAADKKYESLHLKKLMQKLGAVYEDDLQLQPSDYLEQDYNDALPPPVSSIEQDFSEFSDNEFPHGPPRHMAGSAHMRHSGHRGVKEPISFIGGCPSSLGIEDGHTIADKTRHYKLCQPVHKLPVCKHFRDYTWSLTTSADLNVTEQIVHCRCPKNSVTYLTKREPAGTNGYTYLFACSPLTRIRCQRKQPCKLFTVRKRQEFLDEVNINSLCQCPKGHHCPSHHTQSSVIAGESFLEDNIQTYSGYCMAND